ncbi:MAG: cytochrome c [bacterium]|nr:cytochrome c [bacterium]
MSNMCRFSWVLGAVVVLLAVLAPPVWAEDPVSDFKQKCSSCHTIGGGKLTGPDLKDVGKRKDREWLLRFVVDPGAVIDSGDSYALDLVSKFNNVRMPNISGMSTKRAELLLDLIDAESKLEKSQFAGVKISNRPFTQADIDLGRAYFEGTSRLHAGGAACISCHNIGGTRGFGGGRLGPDLTKVYERYGDRTKLGAWLSAPATATMLPTFREHPLDVDSEILPLVAYFEYTAKNEQETPTGGPMSLFLLLAFFGTAVFLALAGRIWNFRFHAVRAPLVQRARWKASDGQSGASQSTSDPS